MATNFAGPGGSTRQVTLLGRRFTVRVVEGGSGRSKGALEGNEVTVSLAAGLSKAARKDHAMRLSRRVIAAALLPQVSERVRRLDGDHFNSGVSRVSIKDMRSRWGSCNPVRKSISLNFRLLAAPEGILDYVIIHELSHIREPSHGRAFWNAVEEALPDYSESRRWLRRNGRSLARQQ